MAMRTRPERPLDSGPIRRVHQQAFGRDEEANLVDALRHEESAIISLVAEVDGEIIGHVMLSNMQAPFRALALAPVAVLPEWQGKGLGSALIRDGLARAKAAGYDGVFVLGEPAYYSRFGFDAGQASGFQSPYTGPYLMTLALQAADLPCASGRIGYAPAFARFE